MDFASLKLLIATIDAKSVSKGAERVHLVTSAASKRIAQLEDQLGVTLLQRHGWGVEPTAAGAMLYQHAKVLLRNIAQAKDSLASFSSTGAPSIRLMANATTVLQFMPREISLFAKKSPMSRVDLVEAFSYDIPAMVADNKADIGIYHAEYPTSGVDSMLYRTDRVVLVVPEGHELSRVKSMRFSDALDYDILGYFPRHSLDEFLALAGSTIARPIKVRAQVTIPEARCAMVREGLGLALVPEGIARNYIGRFGLVIVELLDAWAGRDLFVCVRDRQSLPPQVKLLWEHLLEEKRPD